MTVSDGTLSDTESTSQITVNYNTSGILQPVNWTQGSQDPSIFKWGSTLPVKVRFFNCDGTNAGSGLSVKVEVKKIAGSTPADGVTETITNTNSPDSGGFMRWSGDLYMYNLYTGSLSDKTATYEITLDRPIHGTDRQDALRYEGQVGTARGRPSRMRRPPFPSRPPAHRLPDSLRRKLFLS